MGGRPDKGHPPGAATTGGTPAARQRLCIMVARDSLCAVVNSDRVEGVLVVFDRGDDIESFALPGVTVVARPGPNSTTRFLRAFRSLAPTAPIDASGCVGVLPDWLRDAGGQSGSEGSSWDHRDS